MHRLESSVKHYYIVGGKRAGSLQEAGEERVKSGVPKVAGKSPRNRKTSPPPLY